MTALVEAGEDPEVVYADQPPAFSFKKARAKIFAEDMTIQKLSELMGGNDKGRIVNWKYVARTDGICTFPSPFLPSPLSLPTLQPIQTTK